MVNEKSVSSKQEVVDVVFCFDEKLARCVCVAIKSLLMAHISKEYQYCIHCLTIPAGKKEVENYLQLLTNEYNCSIKFYLVEETLFNNSFEIRNISTATYFRFLIPELLPNVNEVIYLDVDVIIKGELRDLMQFEMKGLFFRGVKAYLNLPEVWEKERKQKYWDEMEKCYGKYINAGVLLMNLKAIRESGIVKKWESLSQNKYYYQDQDIINLTCNEKCGFIPLKYNMFAYFDDEVLMRMAKEKIHIESEIDEAVCNPVIVHYSGPKPWHTFLIRRRYLADEWWKVIFDDKVLFEWFKLDLMNCIQNAQDEYQSMSWKAKRNNANYLFMNEWFGLKQEGCNLADKLKVRSYNSIAIYGMSHIGQRLYDELRNSDIVVKYAIDRVKNENINNVEIYNPDENLPYVDAIIVTAVFSYEEIVKKLSEKVKVPIISIQELI